MKRRSVVVIGGILILVVGFAALTAYRGSPAYAIKRLTAAVAANDANAFQVYVDLDAVGENIVDSMMSEAIADAVDSDAGGFAMMGMSMLREMKPAVAADLRRAVLQSVEEGRLVARNEPRIGDVLGAENVILYTELAGIGEVRKHGTTATADLRTRYEGIDSVFTVRLRMEKQANSWRVVAVDDLLGHLKVMEQTMERRVDEFNSAQLERISAMVSVGAAKANVQPHGLFGRSVALEAPVTNTGTDTIQTGIVAFIRIGAERLTYELHPGVGMFRASFSNLPPGETTIVRTHRTVTDASNARHTAAARGSVVPAVTGIATTRDEVIVESIMTAMDWGQYRREAGDESR